MDQTFQSEPVISRPVYTCDQCRRTISQGRAFGFKARSSHPGESRPQSDGQMTKCFPCALRHRPMLGRSFKAALLVGTVLTVLNQGDLLLSGQWHDALYWKIPLTFCVPFIVATYGALTNSRK